MMEVLLIPGDFSICRLESVSQVDFSDPYCFVSKTDEEISLVCGTDYVPPNTIRREDGWKAFRIQGVLDFSLIGVLSQISTLLADNKIGIFAISTYNTDYILTKKSQFDQALRALADNGYTITEN